VTGLIPLLVPALPASVPTAMPSPYMSPPSPQPTPASLLSHSLHPTLPIPYLGPPVSLTGPPISLPGPIASRPRLYTASLALQSMPAVTRGGGTPPSRICDAAAACRGPLPPTDSALVDVVGLLPAPSTPRRLRRRPLPRAAPCCDIASHALPSCGTASP
jgi:hypothetical protein